MRMGNVVGGGGNVCHGDRRMSGRREEGGAGCTTQRICVKITCISPLLPIGMEYSG